MEQRLSGLQSGSLHANVEIEAFKTRIETLEAEKRDTIAALERKVSEVDQVNEDYRTMSIRYQEAKKECSKFESEARESRASEQTQKVTGATLFSH
jgi:predicted  nucleic acid-binding Zn-ribbon protein